MKIIMRTLLKNLEKLTQISYVPVFAVFIMFLKRNIDNDKINRENPACLNI